MANEYPAGEFLDRRYILSAIGSTPFRLALATIPCARDTLREIRICGPIEKLSTQYRVDMLPLRDGRDRQITLVSGCVSKYPFFRALLRLPAR